MIVKKQDERYSVQFEALREIAHTEADLRHFGSFNDQIRSEKNDRGVAILAATHVEIALRYALARRLAVKKEQYKLRFGDRSPLSTFDQKVRKAFDLEIFGQQSKTNLDIVRRIRNAFAHAHIPITFETDQVRDVCRLLIIPELIPPYSIKVDRDGNILPRELPMTHRDRFRIVCENLAHNLLIYGSRCSQTHRLAAQDNKNKVLSWPNPLA